MVKNKKEIKIVRESATNYTFLDPGFIDSGKESVDTENKTLLNTEKEVLKTRSIDLKKTKIRNKNRLAGGQKKQSHSSVYE